MLGVVGKNWQQGGRDGEKRLVWYSPLVPPAGISTDSYSGLQWPRQLLYLHAWLYRRRKLTVRNSVSSCLWNETQRQSLWCIEYSSACCGDWRIGVAVCIQPAEILLACMYRKFRLISFDCICIMSGHDWAPNDLIYHRERNFWQLNIS